MVLMPYNFWIWNISEFCKYNLKAIALLHLKIIRWSLSKNNAQEQIHRF